MEIRKTWFSYLSIFLYICGGILIFVYAVNGLGNGQEYPYYVKGMSLIVIAAAYLIVAILAVAGARLQIEKMGEKHPAFWTICEWGMAAVILITSFLLRIWVIKEYPMQPQSDYKTYYEIAGLLNRNTLIEEGPGYCDYVAIFPHVLGYSYVLSVILKIFGNSVWVGQLFNAIFAVVTCFFVWRISVMLCGRISGMAGLILSAFWPSQILYQTFLASEYLFSMLLVICIWLFLSVVIRCKGMTERPGLGLLLHIVLGVLIGLDSAIRPMALLLLISILICLVPCRMNLPIKPRNDLLLSVRALETGAVRGGIIVGAYLLTSVIVTKCVAFTTDKELAAGTASFGYNLLVGLNENSYGGWNEDDSQYLYDVMNSSGSPVKAQIACRDLAFKRLRTDKESLLNLFLHKYDVLWSNDDYASSFNLIFLKEQGTLTKEMEQTLLQTRNFGNYWYLVCVGFSVIAALYMLKNHGDWSIVLIILFLGTAAMHLIVENQNRYHFHALYLLVILTSRALHYIYEDLKNRIVIGNKRKEWKVQFELEQELAMARIAEAQKYADEQRRSKLEGCFDMSKALRDGNVVMSVTQIYDENPKPSMNSEQQPRQIMVMEMDKSEPANEEQPASVIGEAAAAMEPVEKKKIEQPSKAKKRTAAVYKHRKYVHYLERGSIKKKKRNKRTIFQKLTYNRRKSS